MSSTDFQDDLFNAQVEAAAEQRLQKLVKDPDALARLLVERNRELADVTATLNQVSADYSRLTDADGNYDMKDAAKLLKYHRGDEKQVGRTELMAFLRDIQFLNQNNSPAQSTIDNGWADEITGTYTKNEVEHVYTKTVVTPKGLDRMRRLMEDAFEEWWSN